MDTSGTSSVGVGNGPASHEAEVLELLAELSAKQRIVIDALVLGYSVSGAAEKAGVHRGTVSRWILKDVHFIAALNALELEVIRAGHTRLVNLVPTALMAIENAINRGDVRAALQVVKYGLFSGRTVGSMSSKLVAKELEVAELQQEVALYQQQTDLERLHEETVDRAWSVSVDRNSRLRQEKEAADRQQRRQEEAAREAAEARAKEAQRQAASAQKQTPSAQPKRTPSPAAQPPKHPGQSDSRERDVRITAAAQAVANALSNPGIAPSQSASSPDANRAQNPGTRANP